MLKLGLSSNGLWAEQGRMVGWRNKKGRRGSGRGRQGEREMESGGEVWEERER